MILMDKSWDPTELILSNQKIKIEKAHQEYEAKRTITLVLTLIAIVVSILAVFSFIGLVSNTGLVNVQDNVTRSWLQTVQIALFHSGGIVLGILSGISLLAWGLRFLI